MPQIAVTGSAELPGLLELLSGPVDEVAPRLLGAVVRRGEVTVRLTEVEAYGGADDPGSHAYRGRTRRNDTMFEIAGSLYCYLSYGMHVCANIVVGAEGLPGAVLLRAGEIVDGVVVARSRRGSSSDRDLARGPARLCQALGIQLADDGTDVMNGPVRLEAGTPVDAVEQGPRVGLRGAPERPWRFWTPGERSVSGYRPAARR